MYTYINAGLPLYVLYCGTFKTMYVLNGCSWRSWKYFSLDNLSHDTETYLCFFAELI